MSKLNVTYEHIVETISSELQHIRKVNDIHSLKTDTELIRIICNTCDSYVMRHNLNIDKHNLILDVIIKLFDITHEEKNYILHKIRIILNNNDESKKTYFEWLYNIFTYICCIFS